MFKEDATSSMVTRQSTITTSTACWMLSCVVGIDVCSAPPFCFTLSDICCLFVCCLPVCNLMYVSLLSVCRLSTVCLSAAYLSSVCLSIWCLLSAVCYLYSVYSLSAICSLSVSYLSTLCRLSVCWVYVSLLYVCLLSASARISVCSFATLKFLQYSKYQ